MRETGRDVFPCCFLFSVFTLTLKLVSSCSVSVLHISQVLTLCAKLWDSWNFFFVLLSQSVVASGYIWMWRRVFLFWQVPTRKWRTCTLRNAHTKTNCIFIRALEWIFSLITKDSPWMSKKEGSGQSRDQSCQAGLIWVEVAAGGGGGQAALFYRSADASQPENVLRNPDNFLQSPI